LPSQPADHRKNGIFLIQLSLPDQEADSEWITRIPSRPAQLLIVCRLYAKIRCKLKRWFRFYFSGVDARTGPLPSMSSSPVSGN
jgi:hypothetical protein